jgi:F-type H+-transporting ATPase subunit b
MKSSIRIVSLILFSCALLLPASAQKRTPAAPTGNAQKNSAAPAAPNQGSKSDAFAPSSANSNQELTHASNEAAGRTPQDASVEKHAAGESEADEEAAFKFSPAVRGIARVTGLSLEGAYWLCVVINFGIVAVLIVLALKSNLPAMFRGRTQEIQKGMEDARRASEDANRRLQEIEARLARMNVEISEMQKHSEHEAKAEEERIRASIEEEKNKILESAHHEMTQATSTARRELQKYAVELAVAMAEKGIRVDADQDKALVEDFAEQLTADARRNGSS